ncbi:hypothetical protein BDZ97DRAFT_1853534 [Flammula alnicola]|nr:hypothetical protein BDZ97DRAFT_1853534 [Flammula alnicola]
MESSSSKPDANTLDDLTPSSSSGSRLPKQKLTALARLKSFGGSFVNYRKHPPSIVFPPPSWELDDELLGKYTTHSPPALLESNYEEPVAVEPPEAVSFAKKIRALIESLPLSLPGAFSSSTQPTSSGPEAQVDDGKQGSPVPPGMDEGLVRMLSSEDVMNGNRPTSSNESDKERPGVWNILAGLKKSGGEEGSPRPTAVEEEEEGIMMYAPLEPKNDSRLELAESETILEYVDEPTSTVTNRPVESGSTRKSSAKSNHAVIEKHAWVPSTTQISLLTTWWGYRLYLPPPVMGKLDGASLQATARAAMITTALKWLLEKIPILLVPPQFRPAVKMLKQLSPVVGYVGVFIAWSWDRVRALDKGNGVVLTATWLLPVALLPMSWDAGDIYGPRPRPKAEEISAAAKEEDKSTDDDNSADKGKKKEEKKKSLFHW